MVFDTTAMVRMSLGPYASCLQPRDYTGMLPYSHFPKLVKPSAILRIVTYSMNHTMIKQIWSKFQSQVTHRNRIT